MSVLYVAFYRWFTSRSTIGRRNERRRQVDAAVHESVSIQVRCDDVRPDISHPLNLGPIRPRVGQRTPRSSHRFATLLLAAFWIRDHVCTLVATLVGDTLVGDRTVTADRGVLRLPRASLVGRRSFRCQSWSLPGILQSTRTSRRIFLGSKTLLSKIRADLEPPISVASSIECLHSSAGISYSRDRMGL